MLQCTTVSWVPIENLNQKSLTNSETDHLRGAVVLSIDFGVQGFMGSCRDI